MSVHGAQEGPGKAARLHQTGGVDRGRRAGGQQEEGNKKAGRSARLFCGGTRRAAASSL